MVSLFSLNVNASFGDVRSGDLYDDAIDYVEEEGIVMVTPT